MSRVGRTDPRSRGPRRALVAAATFGALALPAVLPAGTVLTTTAYAAPVVAEAPAAKQAVTLRVASFNVRNANTYEHHHNEKRWADRRDTVVQEILGQHLDVLGVQEATQGLLHDAESEGRKITQYDDLVARLGGGWQVTNPSHYNCVRDWTPNGCDYAYTGASEGVRILYDATRVTMLDQGSKKLPVPKGKGDNYMAWAKFEPVGGGQAFLVSNLHTVSKDGDFSWKVKQAKATLAELQAHNPGNALPMISLGDWNSSRFEKPSNGPYDVFRKAGFADPLSQKYRAHKLKHPTPKSRIKVWLNSSNPKWSRKAPNHKSWGLGSYIDYIMITKMHATQWETVAKLDKKGKFVGTIPSDHNMIRVSLTLS